MSEKMYLKTQTMINDKTKMVSIKAVTSNSLRMYFYFYSTKIAKLRERERAKGRLRKVTEMSFIDS